MEYTLMHRNIPVVPVEIDRETGVISKVGTAYEIERIPVGISAKDGTPNRGDLNDWWQGRSIPASRQNIRQALKTLGVSSTDKLLTRCYGLSLSDQYWINPVQDPLDWNEINFFDNPFSQDVGNVLFGDVPTEKLNLISPNNTSDGWLKKKWQIIDGKRCLIKGGSDPFWQQPINEVMAAIIMRRLDIPHVDYTLVWEEGYPYSVCENFITRDTELVSAYYIHNTQKISDSINLFEHYVKCCEAIGIPNIRKSLDQMIIVDYLIANSDRHMNNFGAVRDVETLEWVHAAPLFDNGSSFWYNQAVVREDVPVTCQPFCQTHEEQCKLVSDLSWVNLAALKGIDDEINELFATSSLIEATRSSAICASIMERVKKLDQLLNSKTVF